MSSLFIRAGAVALTLTACAVDSRLDTPSVEATASPNDGTVVVDPPPPPPLASGVRLMTATADGAAASVFANADAVNIITDGINAEGDYYFDVTAIVHPPNAPNDMVFLTNDAVDCRRFHIGASGHIESVAAQLDFNGARCERAVSGDAATGLALKLMPYDLSFDSIVETDSSGNRVYRVRIAPVGDALVEGYTTLFTIEPTPPCDPSCSSCPGN